jgi:hypothetical protein
MGEGREAIRRSRRLIPDPRRYGSGDAPNPLLRLAEEGQHRELTNAFRELASAGRDAEIRESLAAAPSAPVYARLWQALCAAVEKPPRDHRVATRVFAIPWVIVCGASTNATLTCVLPDVQELARVLEASGVFGPSRNVGLGTALASIELIEAIAPSELLEWTANPEVRDVPPAPIELTRGGEEVHVRLLLGAAIVPAAAPDIAETGSNVGMWGTPALRALRAQLATPGVQILPMPRPPAGLYSAAYAGRRAGIEAAFNLFVSNTLRRFRGIVGDAQVNLSAHEGPEFRVTLWTPLDEGLVEGFRWPLHPADELDEIERTIKTMISECRLEEPYVAPEVLPAHSPNGAVFFPGK